MPERKWGKPTGRPYFQPGDRVELHPATDHWMRGDRYGTVQAVPGIMIRVKLDKSGKTFPLHSDNLSLVEDNIPYIPKED